MVEAAELVSTQSQFFATFCLKHFLFIHIFSVGFYLLSSLIVFTWISSVSGTVCYECDNVPYSSSNSSCNQTVTCQGNQICFSSTYMNESQTIFHEYGCTEEKECDNAALRVGSLIGKRDNIKICKRCCLGDNCNRQHCKYIHSGICYEWSQWSPCSTTCGSGKETRQRICQRNNTEEIEKASRTCILKLCPGAKCEDATPTCSEAATNKTVCGYQTIALSTCPRSCGLCPVDGNWIEWSQWSDCSATCGINRHKIRMRLCINPPPSNNGADCVGPSEDKQPCAPLPACVVDGGWSTWSDYTPCSVTCGGGINLRTRKCDNPVPSNGGQHCNGSSLEYHTCSTAECPIDGQWSGWSPWHDCSTSCGTGFIFRVRTCSNPAPKHGGTPCADPLSYSETKPCWAGTCPVTTVPPSTSSTTHPTTTTTTVATTRMTSPTMTTTHVTSQPPPTSTHLSPVVGCHDKDFCSDAHILPVVCDDVYMSNTYCPKLCGICGTASQTTTCQDQVGHSCQDQLYARFVCSDKELSSLCSKTCGLCH